MSKNNETVLPAKRGRPQNFSTELDNQVNWDQAPELKLTKEQAEKLAPIEKILTHELAELFSLYRQVAIRNVRIGVLILWARKDILSGQFIAWCKKSIPMSRDRIWKITRATELFLERSHIDVETACEAMRKYEVADMLDKEKRKQLPEAVQLVFEFIGDKSFEDLCESLGIRPQRYICPGGDRGGGLARHITCEERKRQGDLLIKQVAHEQFAELVDKFRHYVFIDKDHVHLDRKFLHDGLVSIKDCVKALETYLRK